eukprot:SAG31_NODE_705_length_12695_cov_3.147007_12_plen_70_part_00
MQLGWQHGINRSANDKQQSWWPSDSDTLNTRAPSATESFMPVVFMVLIRQEAKVQMLTIIVSTRQCGLV